MAVPKRKTSKSRRNNRRAHLKLEVKHNVIEDKTSGKYRMSHHLDVEEGLYKGRFVFRKKEKQKQPEEST